MKLSDDDIIQATCAVLIEGKIKGTAWVVSEEGHLVTAGHLLGTESPRETVEVRFSEDIPQTAHKILWGYQRDMGIDFSVLKLATPPARRQPLPISLIKTVTGTFRLCGYGQSLVDLSIGKGVFLGFYDRQNSPTNRLFKLDSKQLGQGGYSGGAVVSDNLQAVVAVQIAATGTSTGAERDTVLAMPLYRVARHWEFLKTLAKSRDTSAVTTVKTHNTFVPGYHYDIAVSYASVDDQPIYGAEEGWLTSLIKALKIQLAQKLGSAEAFSLWSDHQLPGNIPISSMFDIFRRSATLLVVLSPGYLMSEWCQRQQNSFLNMVKDRVRRGSRVFVVERDLIDRADRPSEFGDLRGYQFWTRTREGKPPRTLTPKRDSRLYQDLLNELSYDIVQELRRLKTSKNREPFCQ
jgi:hypothetical protein